MKKISRYWLEFLARGAGVPKQIIKQHEDEH
jgi:hypothetical protein